MKHFSKILSPYNFLYNANEALLHASKLADSATNNTLLNVIQLPYLIDPNGFTYYTHKAAEMKLEADLGMTKKVSKSKAIYPTFKFDYLIATDNDSATVILKTQREKDLDLVIIGCHGRKDLVRLSMGSVVESELRDATCPVLIVKNK